MLCLSCGKDAVYEVVGHPRFPEPVGLCQRHRDAVVLDVVALGRWVSLTTRYIRPIPQVVQLALF